MLGNIPGGVCGLGSFRKVARGNEVMNGVGFKGGFVHISDCVNIHCWRN